MATVSHTLTIESTDLTTDSISLSAIQSIVSATQGGIMREKIVPDAIGSAQKIAIASLYSNGAKLWLYNPSTDTTNEKIYISFDSTTDQVILSGGDWAVIPWSAGSSGTVVDLEAYGEVANNILEYGVFQ